MRERVARWLLVVLLLSQFVLLSRQASQRNSGEQPVVERLVVALLGPPARWLTWVGGVVEGVGDGFSTRARLRRDNRRLAGEVGELERELLRLRGLEGDFQRLAAAVDYSRASERPLTLADVVYVDHSSWLRSLLLYVGDGQVAVNQPVVDGQGLVGRVVGVGGRYAKVQLVTDRASGVGAMIDRTGRQGVVRGDERNQLLMEFVPLQADVRAGDRVVTAGMDGVYPRGIPVGVVRSVEPGQELFHRIALAPLVDYGSMDHVYVLATDQAPPELVEGEPDDRR